LTSDHPNRSSRTQRLTPEWWDEPVATPGRRPRLAILVMLLGLLAPFILGVDAVMGPQASPQFTWSDQIDRSAHAYARSLDRPKIIFVGGSNVIFGLHARDLEEALGVPVIAFGLNAGTGLDIIALRVADIVGRGDLVIVQPELNHFCVHGPENDGLRRDFITVYGLASDDPVGRFPRREWVAARVRARAIRTELDSRTRLAVTRAIRPSPARPARATASAAADAPRSPYDLRAIDDRGNVVFPRPRPAPVVNFKAPPPREVQYDWARSEGVKGLRTVAAACRAERAIFAIAPATMVRPESPQAIYEAAVKLREAEMLKLAQSMGAMILLRPGETTLDHDCAFDTTFHLNDTGVAIMQERWLRVLRPFADKMRPSRRDPTSMP
jgi:hypothetical protein